MPDHRVCGMLILPQARAPAFAHGLASRRLRALALARARARDCALASHCLAFPERVRQTQQLSLLSDAAAGVDTVDFVANASSAAGDTAAAAAACPRPPLSALPLGGNSPDPCATGDVNGAESASSTAPDALARGAFLRVDPLGWGLTGAGAAAEPAETCSPLSRQRITHKKYRAAHPRKHAHAGTRAWGRPKGHSRRRTRRTP